MAARFVHPERYARSAELYAEARKTIPGGVNSTARAAFSGWEPHPIFVDHGSGSRVTDVDGNEYIDYLLGLGPAIFGHRPAGITAAVAEAISTRGTVFAMPSAPEVELSQLIVAAVPSVESVRVVNTGTEGVLYALRLARAFTGRKRVVRFEGQYHGFSDGIYWSKHPDLAAAGPDERPVALPQGPGVPAEMGDALVIAQWNDLTMIERIFAEDPEGIAAVITEPIMCNTGCILPRPGYLEGLRALCDRYGAVLIFDEVITGFRIALGGAQAALGVTPDLTVMAKGLGGGFPVAALGGKHEIMDLASEGRVSIAGTYSGNAVAVAAALASLRFLAAAPYDELYARSDRLREGLNGLLEAKGIAGAVVGMGPVYQLWFSDAEIANYRDAARHSRADLFRLWWEEMLDRGVLFHPGHLENLFISFAHDDADVDETLESADGALDAVLARSVVRR
ncbi:MAG TPA: glutamate-1-semialdehyde 2,1-aminomutase [Acidimicrobiales bacterium]|nr:MAG: aspartate aminotransferase family protein [Actinobacteria bacterium 21-73-9]HQU26173.1 glutamate-1-semialdehyde 2,1-aminomutase [Acidimicrobiales bacterium]